MLSLQQWLVYILIKWFEMMYDYIFYVLFSISDFLNQCYDLFIWYLYLDGPWS